MDFKMITEQILPVKIVAKSDNVSGAECLLKAKELQIGLQEKELCTVGGKGYIVLDFGKEYVGGARILTHVTDNSGIAVRLRFGESLTECHAELGERGACNDHSLRDFTTSLVSYSDMTFARTGFRFLRIDFLEEKRVTLKNIYCEYTHRDFPAPKPFDAKDERLNQIFQTAKHTIELCCQGYIWDGIKRDRLVWIGDIHPEMLALTSLYGRCGIIEDSLDFTVNQVHLGEWMNTMPMYSVWWLIILADYAEIVGATDYAKKHSNYIKGLISQINGCVKADGELDFPSYFVDWPTHDQPDELDGCRALLMVGARKAQALCSLLNLPDGEAKELAAKLEKQPIYVRTAKQVLGLKYWATGSLDAREVEMLTAGGAKGMSTFMSYYILKAVAETAGVQTAVDMLAEYYGAMLDMGATSFFEDFDMDWVENTCRLDQMPKAGQRDVHGDFGKYCYMGFRHSFCHGWSTGILRFMYEYCNKVA